MKKLLALFFLGFSLFAQANPDSPLIAPVIYQPQIIGGNISGGTTSGTVTNSSNGDIIVWGVEASKFRSGSWDTTASVIFTLIGESCRYVSHNTALSSAGAFLGRDDTGTAQLEVWTETGVYMRFTSPSAAAGVVPTWALYQSTLTVSTTGGTTVLTSAQSEALHIEVTGALVSNAIIEIPVGSQVLTAENATTGNFTVSYKVTGGTAVVIPRGKKLGVYANGTTVESLDSRMTALTWANLPLPTIVAPYTDQYTVTDYPGRPSAVFSDGTKWRSVALSSQQVLESVPNTTTSTTEVIIKKELLPAGFLTIGDVVNVSAYVSKDNTTNAQTANARIGTLGTTGDTLIGSAVAIAAGTTNAPVSVFSFIVKSATTIEVTSGLGSGSLTTTTKTVTIPNISNALYLDFGIKNDTSTATTITQYAWNVAITK